MHTWKMEREWSVVLSVLTLIAVGAMLWARRAHLGFPVWPVTCVASTGFIATALARGVWRHGAGRWTLAALGFCWLGDMGGPLHFMAGVAAFMGGHVMFMVAFAHRTLRLRPVLFAVVPVAAVIGVIASWLLPHVSPEDWVPVVTYISLITLMWLFACSAVHDAGGRLALFGATVFFVSDIFVARWRYVDQSSVNAFFCYPLYYFACLVLAWAAGYPSVRQSAR